MAPPENVTLSCSNVNVSVSWEHRGQTPRTIFSVLVGGSGSGRLVDETTERRYDLSRFVWSQQRYQDFHDVTVVAKEDGDQANSTTTTFSFNRNKPADVKCKLDFPTVDLNETESGATLSFMNPLRFYKELKEASKTSSTIKFTASSNTEDLVRHCTEEERVCKLDISFPDGEEKCVKTLTGVWFDGSGSAEVEFRDTGPIWASSSTEADVLTFSLLLLLLCGVLVAVIIAVWMVKGWTMETLPREKLPEPVIIGPLSYNKDSCYALVSPVDVSRVALVDVQPCKNPSVSTEEKEDAEEEDKKAPALQGNGAGSPLYKEGGFSEDSERTETVSLEEVEDAEEEDKKAPALQGNGAGSPMYEARGFSEDSEEVEVLVEVSPYDCPHILQVDMGNGDMITCYNHRT